MQGLAIESVAIRDLDDAAKVHDRDSVGDVLHHGQVVRHEEQGQIKLGLELGQQVEDLSLDRDVEGGHRFIGDDQAGSQDQSSGDADPLSLTT